MAAGIQIPQVKRDDSPAPAQAAEPRSVGRITVNAPDGTKAFEKNIAGFEKVADTAVAYAQKVEHDTADTYATKAASDYEVEYRKKLYGDGQTPGIKFQEGDPTPLYNQFDQDMKKRFDEISGDPSLSGIQKELTIKKLTNTANQLELNRLSEYGNQQAKYDDHVATAAVELKKSNMIDASTYIKPGDDSSFAPFDAAVADIRDIKLRRGMKLGAVTPDENGKSIYVDDSGNPVRVNVGPSADYELKKDLSDGIYNAMDNLIKSGQTDKANALREKYGNYLDPVKRRSIADDFYKADVKAQSYAAADEANKVGMDKAFKDLKPEIKDKALEILDSQQRRKQDIVDRASKTNFNTLSNYLDEKMRNDPSAFLSVTDLENDPRFKHQIDRVTDAKQKEALYQKVEAPKNSSIDAKVKMQNLFAGDNPEYQTELPKPEDFALMKRGLSKPDQAKYDTKYERMRSNPEEYANSKRAASELTTQLIGVGYLKRDDYGKISGKYELAQIQARNEFEDHVAKMGKLSPVELKDEALKFAVSKKTGTAYAPPEKKVFVGTTTSNTPAPPPAGTTQTIIGGKTKLDWARQFKQANGKMPDLKTDELQNFINKQSGK